MELNKRDFKGVWIPKDIWLNKDLSITEKCVLIEIDSLDNDEEKGCFASNEYLGEFFDMKEGSMANLVSNLKKRGYISQVFFDGRNRGLRANKNMKADSKASFKNESGFNKNMKADPTKKVKQRSQKNEHINIDSNTVNNKEDIIINKKNENSDNSDFIPVEEKSEIQIIEIPKTKAAKGARPKKETGLLLRDAYTVETFETMWQLNLSNNKKHFSEFAEIDASKVYDSMLSWSNNRDAKKKDWYMTAVNWVRNETNKSKYKYSQASNVMEMAKKMFVPTIEEDIKF